MKGAVGHGWKHLETFDHDFDLGFRDLRTFFRYYFLYTDIVVS